MESGVSDLPESVREFLETGEWELTPKQRSNITEIVSNKNNELTLSESVS